MAQTESFPRLAARIGPFATDPVPRRFDLTAPAQKSDSMLNSLQRAYLDRYGLPYSLREDFKKSMERVAAIPNDIFLGNHMHQNRTAEKYKALIAGDRFAFIDRDGSAAYALSQKKALEELEASENR